MQRFAFIGDRGEDGRVMVVIVQVPSGSTTGEVIDARFCTDDERTEYLNEWLGVDRPAVPVYVKPMIN